LGMLTNSSVPANILLPHIAYKDLPAAIAWLHNAFGFVEHYRYGDPISGAQVHLGDAWMMLNAARHRYRSPAELGFGTQSLTIFVEDVEAHFAHAKAAGAIIVEELHETVYGELQYGVEDPEGHHWLFSCHAHDVNPAAWGATIASAL
jgi:uncharacterized glyoxalase superfamily protein PhnB